MAAPKLSDYALIGNSRSAALVCKTGSVEWCCLPEFDSPSLFAALLDREKGGFFSITPVADFQSNQQYLPDTNVLKTSFKSEEGEIRLLDAFTARTEEEKRQTLFAEHEILRVLEGVSGTVRLRMQYAPRPFYGKYIPHLEDRMKLGIHLAWKGHLFTLHSTLEAPPIRMLGEPPHTAVCDFSIKAGDRVIFSLSYSSQSPAVLPELKITGWERMEATIRFWKNWMGQCQYTGLYQEQVRRSALALKLLTHAPSGAIIAAPTTSLPEQVGGVRNWDYRYCWLRDASFTVRVLLALGFMEEARAYMSWILHATRLTRPKIQVVYSVYGHARIPEQAVDWLQGYRGSRPVHIGNSADDQFQLDLYGEVLDAIHAYSPFVERFDRATRNFILGLGEAICELWDKPDHGIWEVRSQRVHHTHSKALAWVGLNCLLGLAKKYGWKKAPLEKYEEVASRIANEIEQFGYNKDLKAYSRELKGNALDASLLTLPLLGYCAPDNPRIVSTCKEIYARLSENGLIYRYRDVDDGLPGQEGFFAVCNFWLVENLIKSGEPQKGIDLFEALLKYASPTGLFSEEIDPESNELIGNYPQGFTHIGLISAALAINEYHQKEAKAT